VKGSPLRRMTEQPARIVAMETGEPPGPVREMGAVRFERTSRLMDASEKAARTDAALRRLRTIPGVGPVTAGAGAAVARDLDTFEGGRDVAARLGLVPRQMPTGGRVRPGAVGKMGRTDIRRVLIVGASRQRRTPRAARVIRRVVSRGGSPNRWLAALVARKPKTVAAVGLANETARMIQAVTTKRENCGMA